MKTNDYYVKSCPGGHLFWFPILAGGAFMDHAFNRFRLTMIEQDHLKSTASGGRVRPGGFSGSHERESGQWVTPGKSRDDRGPFGRSCNIVPRAAEPVFPVAGPGRYR